MLDKFVQWLKDRYPIDTMKELLSKKEVPLHRYTLFYYFGGFTLFCFILQVATGVLLLFYYKPSTEQAFEAVKLVMTKVEFGWLVRSIHAWSANLMILSAFAHMFSVYFLKAYRPPRELTWMSGMMLLVLGLGFGFTGYLLPWNELSFFATKVGIGIAGSVPFAGEWIRTILQGGAEVGDATLTRFFALHVMVIPLCFAAFLVLHLAMIQFQGMSEPIGFQAKKEGKKIPFFPSFVMREGLVWVITLGVVVGLSFYLPAELGKKADPFAPTPIGIQPEWYFLFMFETLKLFPGKIFFLDGELVCLGIFALGGLALFFVPFLDRAAQRERKYWLFSVLGFLLLLYMVGMTLWGHFIAGKG